MSRHHSYRRRVRRRRRVAPRLLLLAVIAAAVLTVTNPAIGLLLGRAVVGLFLIVGLIALVRTVRLVRAARHWAGSVGLTRPPRPAGWAAGSARLPKPRPAQPESDWRADWRAARQRFDALRAEYGAYECDPLAVLRLPALADVTVPSTGRFVDAFAEAQALHGEQEDREPPADYAASYVHAVDRAWQAWRAARDAAERIRLAGLSEEERASVQRVIKLLTVAKDSGNDAERVAAYAKARAELAKLERAGHIHLPRPAMAALDASARAGLPAGFPTQASADRAARPA